MFRKQRCGIIFLMEISYLGHSCFKIKGKQATVVIDPYSPSVGFRMPKVEADVVTISHAHADHNFIEGVRGEPFVIFEPGEYEIKGIEIWGVATFHDDEGGAKRGKNIVHHIKIDEITIVHLGDLGHKLTPEQIEHLNEVDVLLVPVGGFYTIDAAAAREVIDQLEPKVVIPMHFRTKKHNEELFKEVDGLDVFLKEMGEEKIEPQKKLKIKNKSELPEERKVIVLKENLRG